MSSVATNHVRSLSLLTLGTGLTFATAVAATSVTARLYEASDFGTLATFMAWIAVPTAVANLRLSDAIPLSKTAALEACLIQASLETTLIICVLLSMLLAGLAVLDVLPLPLKLFLPLAMAVVVASSIHRLACMVATKDGRFGWLMVLSVALPFATGLGQVLGWQLGWSLTAGTALGITLSSTPAAVLLLPRLTNLTLQRPMLPLALRAFPDFARHAAPFAALGALRTRGFYFVVGLPDSRISPTEVGSLQQAERVSGWANSGLTSVLRPAFHHSATVNPSQAAINAIETSGLLIQAIAGPATLLAIYSDSITELILGHGWDQSSESLRWLVIPASLFAATNFSDRLFDMLRRQGVLLTLEVAAALLTLLAAVLASIFSRSIHNLVVALALITALHSIGQFVALGVICRASWILLAKPIAIFAMISGLIVTIDHIGRTMFASSLLGLTTTLLCTSVMSMQVIRLFQRNRV